MHNMSELKKVVVVLVIIVAVALWEGFGGLFFSYPMVNYPPRGPRVMVWGDSLSIGVGASTPIHGYVGVLSDRLTLNLVNKAGKGETTKDALLHAEQDLSEVRPDIVLIFLGGNDLLQGVTPQETFTNLRALIDKAHAQKAVVYLIGFQKHPDDVYAKNFAALARDSGSLYTADIFGGVSADATAMADEVHPNDRGYLKMADKIAPDLEGLVLAGGKESTPAHD